MKWMVSYRVLQFPQTFEGQVVLSAFDPNNLDQVCEEVGFRTGYDPNIIFILDYYPVA